MCTWEAELSETLGDALLIARSHHVVRTWLKRPYLEFISASREAFLI